MRVREEVAAKSDIKMKWDMSERGAESFLSLSRDAIIWREISFRFELQTDFKT